jgi:hypothetical protein
MLDPKLIKETEILILAMNVRSWVINVRRRDGSMPEAIIEA